MNGLETDLLWLADLLWRSALVFALCELARFFRRLPAVPVVPASLVASLPLTFTGTQKPVTERTPGHAEPEASGPRAPAAFTPDNRPLPAAGSLVIECGRCAFDVSGPPVGQRLSGSQFVSVYKCPNCSAELEAAAEDTELDAH